MVEIKYETNKAYLVTDGYKEVWLPKSQILEKTRINGGTFEMLIPEWLATKNDLV